MAPPLIPLGLRMALRHLTVLPVRYDPAEAEAEAARALPWFPLAGVAIGLAVAAALTLPLPPLVRAAVALLVWIGVTGALHEDGVMDCADAAFAPVTRERRLEILRDPRVGAFGVAAEGLTLLLRFAALASVPPVAPLTAAVGGRWVMTLSLAFWPPARKAGLGARFARGATWTAPTLTAVGALVGVTAIAQRVSSDGGRVVASSVAALVAGLATSWWLARRFGGLTGDAHGASAVAAECAGLLTWVAGHATVLA